MTDQQALERLAANVKRLRTEAGMSISDLARRIDDYPRTVHRIEEELNVPGLGLVTRLAEALGVTLDALVQVSTANKPAQRSATSAMRR